MSTFGGVMVEFPEIRVDFFRPVKDMQPPLACFLSHVHSDHLNGLESLKSPFVYCSAATKEILLRLERRAHRLNFASGILEARKLTYRHLKLLLKPIPLETPTRIELSPGKEIQVTLFDANHCTGAVMFLFESEGKAVLYTGDIRSELWFVNNLRRNPFLIEYTSGLKTLDCIYLDTSNLDPMTFPPKADGLKELLQKVVQYPDDTVFHFSAWTFGYEEVWMALSRALKSPIHVDKYKLRLYQALRGDTSTNQSGPFLAHEGPVLTGYQCGNTPQEGCLTTDPAARIHSCEKGMNCPAINNKIVWIKPIITRLEDGSEIAEIGIGGGWGDLAQRPELRLDSEMVVGQLLQLFGSFGDPLVADIKTAFLEKLRTSGGAIPLDNMGTKGEDDEMPLEDLMKSILGTITQKQSDDAEKRKELESEYGCLPKTITFPYSRHSSYPELVDLVRVFRPKDVYPCTVDEFSWHEGISIRKLFGNECSTTTFRHDAKMEELLMQREEATQAQAQTQARESQPSTEHPLTRSPVRQPSFTPKPVGRVTIRRNPQGLLRAFDAEGNEVSLAQRQASTVSFQDPGSAPTNGTHINSPNSASQGLRRKAIAHEISQGPAKRPHLSIDGSDPSPPPETAPMPATTSANATNSSEKVVRYLPWAKPPSTVAIKTEPAVNSQPGDSSQSVNPSSSTTKSKSSGIVDLTNLSSSPPQSPQPPRNPVHKRLDRQSCPPVETILPPLAAQPSPPMLPAIPAAVRDDSSGNSSRANTPGSKDDSEPEQQISQGPLRPRFSPWVDYRGNEVEGEEDSWYPNDDWRAETYFDNIDMVERCFFCNHERWAKPRGFCTNCLEGQTGTPYFEVLDPEAGARPVYEVDENAGQKGFDMNGHLADHMDCHASAYDSQDEEYVYEEYEKDSFIDDSSQHDPNDEEEAPSSDGETDYKEKFKHLQEAHAALQRKHDLTAEAFEGLSRQVMGSAYENQYLSDLDDENEDEGEDDVEGEFDEDGALIVDIPIHDPVITELIVSSAQEQSQSSEVSPLSPERVKKRVEAFEAALNNEWHTIALASTAENNEEMDRQISVEL